MNWMEDTELLMPFLIPEAAGRGKALLPRYTWMKQEKCVFQTLEAKGPPRKRSPEALCEEGSEVKLLEKWQKTERKKKKRVKTEKV